MVSWSGWATRSRPTRCVEDPAHCRGRPRTATGRADLDPVPDRPSQRHPGLRPPARGHDRPQTSLRLVRHRDRHPQGAPARCYAQPDRGMGGPAGPQPRPGPGRPRRPVQVPDPRPGHEVYRLVRRGLYRGRRADCSHSGAGASGERVRRTLDPPPHGGSAWTTSSSTANDIFSTPWARTSRTTTGTGRTKPANNSRQPFDKAPPPITDLAAARSDDKRPSMDSSASMPEQRNPNRVDKRYKPSQTEYSSGTGYLARRVRHPNKPRRARDAPSTDWSPTTCGDRLLPRPSSGVPRATGLLGHRRTAQPLSRSRSR